MKRVYLPFAGAKIHIFLIPVAYLLHFCKNCMVFFGRSGVEVEVVCWKTAEKCNENVTLWVFAMVISVTKMLHYT